MLLQRNQTKRPNKGTLVPKTTFRCVIFWTHTLIVALAYIIDVGFCEITRPNLLLGKAQNTIIFVFILFTHIRGTLSNVCNVNARLFKAPNNRNFFWPKMSISKGRTVIIFSSVTLTYIAWGFTLSMPGTFYPR